MLKQKYFLTDFFILSAEKQPIKLSWRNIEWLLASLDWHAVEAACPDFPLLYLLTFSFEIIHTLLSYGEGLYLRAPPAGSFV